jgi:hypothetical protein
MSCPPGPRSRDPIPAAVAAAENVLAAALAKAKGDDSFSAEVIRRLLGGFAELKLIADGQREGDLRTEIVHLLALANCAHELGRGQDWQRPGDGRFTAQADAVRAQMVAVANMEPEERDRHLDEIVQRVRRTQRQLERRDSSQLMAADRVGRRGGRREGGRPRAARRAAGIRSGTDPGESDPEPESPVGAVA